MKEISCKHCGGYVGSVHQGKGPHAYELKCSACDKHIKWLSELDAVDHTLDEVGAMINEQQWAAILAAKSGDFKSFYGITVKIDKLLQRIHEMAA